MVKLSVVVPVYNVEKYIGECIESILRQTLNDIEVIIVNDGSTDESINKVREFNDERIKIINKQNGGLSSARNRGIKECTGEYIIFIDSDDFISESNSLEDIYILAKETNSDVVCGNALIYNNNERKYPMKRSIEIKNSKLLKPVDFLKKSMGFDWAPVPLYCYKICFIKINRLMFKEGIFHEDELFTPQVILKSNQIAIYDKEFYVYRQRQGSIMHDKLNTKKGYDIIDTCIELEQIFNDIDDADLKNKLFERSVWIIFDNICKYDLTNIPKHVRKYVLRRSNTKSTRIRSIILFINIKLYIKIHRIWIKFKS